MHVLFLDCNVCDRYTLIYPNHKSLHINFCALLTELEGHSPYSLGSFTDPEAGPRCQFCLQSPCVVLSQTKPAVLSAHGLPRAQNISKRYKDYKYFYRTLNKAGLWKCSEYLDRKHTLGIFIEDVREVLPNCVVGDVRKRWPSPPEFPYKGHIPILTQDTNVV